MAPKLRTSPRKQPTQKRSQDTVDAILSATAQVLVKRQVQEHSPLATLQFHSPQLMEVESLSAALLSRLVVH